MSLPIVRTSETRDLLRCEWRWEKAWRQGLKPKGTEAIALTLGTWVHTALAAWYCGPGIRRGPHPAETFAQVANDDIETVKTESRHREDGGTYVIEEKYVPARELGIAMLNGYVETYGRDEHMDVIQPERAFQVDVPHPKKGRPMGIYAGTYDLVWRDLRHDREILLEEHKTAKAIFTGHLELDPQAGSYWAIAYHQLQHDGLIGKGDRFVGIEYNFLRKAMPDDRPRNADGYFTNKPTKTHYVDALLAADGALATLSKPLEKWTLAALKEEAEVGRGLKVFGEVSAVQPKPLFERLTVERGAHQRARQIGRIQDIMIRMDALKKGKLPVTKNPTRDCSWDCSFYQLCLLDESSGDAAEFQAAVYDVRDPYADHRKSADD